MTEDRRATNAARRLVELWPLWAALAGGVTWGLKLKWDVDDLKSYKEQSLMRHQDTIGRIIRLETDVGWLKGKK